MVSAGGASRSDAGPAPARSLLDVGEVLPPPSPRTAARREKRRLYMRRYRAAGPKQPHHAAGPSASTARKLPADAPVAVQPQLANVDAAGRRKSPEERLAARRVINRLAQRRLRQARKAARVAAAEEEPPVLLEGSPSRARFQAARLWDFFKEANGGYTPEHQAKVLEYFFKKAKAHLKTEFMRSERAPALAVSSPASVMDFSRSSAECDSGVSSDIAKATS